MKRFVQTGAVGLAVSFLGACSTVMEASRPDPIDLNKFPSENVALMSFPV